MPFLDLADARLHYRAEGSGAPAFVFVHGFTCALEDWDLQAEALAPNHRVLRFDLRGHGRSTARAGATDPAFGARDVVAVMDAERVDRAIVVGHSMGCRTALAASRYAPERIAGVVVIDGSYRGADGPDTRAALERAVAAAGGYPSFLAKTFSRMFTDPTPASTAIIERAARLPEAIGVPLYAAMSTWDALELKGALAALPVPLLAIQSTTTPPGKPRQPIGADTPDPYLDLIAELAPHARIERVLGVGHFTMLDAPATVNASLAAFARACG